MCDGALSITKAKDIYDKYGVDVFCFTKETLVCLMSDLAQLDTFMTEEHLDVLPENPVSYEDDDDEWDEEDDCDYEDDDDWCGFEEDEEDDFDCDDDEEWVCDDMNFLDDEETTYSEGPNT